MARKAIELKMSGLTYREIAPILKVSFQRVQQMVRPPRPIWIAVRNRAGGRCERCQIRLRNGSCHHKSYFDLEMEDFNDFDNLQYLCESCHRTAHINPEVEARKLQAIRAEAAKRFPLTYQNIQGIPDVEFDSPKSARINGVRCYLRRMCRLSSSNRAMRIRVAEGLAENGFLIFEARKYALVLPPGTWTSPMVTSFVPKPSKPGAKTCRHDFQGYIDRWDLLPKAKGMTTENRLVSTTEARA